MKVKITNTFLKNTKMPLPKEYRSAKGRRDYATNLSKTFQGYLSYIPVENLPIDVYKGMIYSSIKPLRPNLNIIPITEGKYPHINCDISGKMLDESNKNIEIIYNGYNIYLPLSNENINCDDSILVHETRHLFDYLCNKKLILPRGTQFITEDNYNKFSDILEYIKSDEYKPKKILGLFKKHDLETRLREKFKDLDNEYIIELLQKCRYATELEINAYRDSGLYSLRLNPANIFNVLKYRKHVTDSFEFKHKKKVCEKLLREYINLERTNYGLALQKMDKNR